MDLGHGARGRLLRLRDLVRRDRGARPMIVDNATARRAREAALARFKALQPVQQFAFVASMVGWLTADNEDAVHVDRWLDNAEQL